ncbi:MAG TPA: SusC/RagA family TonB-linked outer membrane protein [Cyclobacteriaceae bacterium]|nr:SusC/RagA family TonB-linked outer membrane protein [Cyclobacteriaceae bacterium]HMX01569.1 SusC/RagA family TonB-linked outer membrane protein [Cyclobacteriaceae bacterium]HMX51430.1 SusC/RagA family TonB-linked outer membrane protein [Cyclobacteriaceae bacterium]HMY92229.1 SusC/RagA family TonB-linked outer membrane protein [Cyclobacteriaceae bacterium]HNA11433.1 SusC/RagA family TonB-linked outer membrane protein [Cyclobacteriaceae bacterium]
MKRLLLSCVTMMLMLAAVQVFAQDRTVSGRVTSAEDGSALPGVSVVLKGTAIGTQTDGEGRYSLSVPAAGGTLTFSFISLKTQEVALTTQSNVDVSMEADAATLNEVVVVAGGLTVQRRELGNQATTIKATDLTQGKSSNAVAGLQGKVPGLLVSAVSSGVNPNFRVVLRGQRSLLGNNQALLVLDNIITPLNLLGNLNPEDIEDIQVLNGAGAAALYGSDASNGALIVTTKRGKAGKTEIKVSNTTTLETVSYLPKLQTKWGSGTTPDTPPVYTPYENQQFGPRFDGTIRPIGKPLEALDPTNTDPYARGHLQQYAKYSHTNGKNDFWETGMQNQTDFAITTGDDKGSIYASGQYFRQHSTVPWDKYKRYSFRANIDRKIGETVKASISTNYITNFFDISPSVGTAFQDVMMSPGEIQITKYKHWRGNPATNFANPNGYYNEYFANPYFTLSNNRAETRNNYFQGTMELKWNPVAPLTLTGRVGMTNRHVFTKQWAGKFTYSDWTKSPAGAGSGSNKTDITGFVADNGFYSTQLVIDFLGEYKTKLSDDLSLTIVGGFQARDNRDNNVGVAANGLVISGVYNVGNSSTNLFGTQTNNRATQMGVYADIRLGFKEWAYLHLTGRNDWRSVLAKENRSFFYPAADVSIILSDAISALKESEWVDALKIRGGYSQVGQVSIGPYQLQTTFNQNYGYPYSSGGGFGLGNTLVSPDLKPEITTSMETGFDLDLKKYSASIGMTVYKSNTVNQTIPVQISSASGFNTFLTNVGEVENKGLETYLQATPIETSFGLSAMFRVTYTLNRNEVISLAEGTTELNIGSLGQGRIVAKVGKPFPYVTVTKYNRTEDGRVIVNPITGFPSTNGVYKNFGTSSPPHIVGLTSEIKYKGFRLAATAEFRTGHFIYNSVATPFDFSGAGIRTGWYNRERFVFPNSAYEDPENPGTYIDNTNVTVATGGADFWTDGSRNTTIGENYTHSAGFWKIREISLRYDFPKAWLSATKFIKAASLSVQGRNLFIWVPKTNLYTDPEYSVFGTDSNAIGFTNINLTPPSRYFGGAISLTF